MIASHLQRKSVEGSDQVVRCSGDAHEGCGLLWPGDGCQQHQPAAYTGSHHDLRSKENNRTYNVETIVQHKMHPKTQAKCLMGPTKGKNKC